MYRALFGLVVLFTSGCAVPRATIDVGVIMSEDSYNKKPYERPLHE